MLTKIREKAQGVFAWAILLLICIPFALWGIQNYLDVGTETPIATVGGKEFFQNDVNRAYAQYSQNLAGMGLDEQTLKQQALDKLVRDEVLLQYVQDIGLVVTDLAASEYIKSLQYFQVDGKFDSKQYKSLLASQNLSSTEFVQRIRHALVMEQFQQSVVNSSFATEYDIENFYKLQNQQRKIEYTIIPVKEIKEKPSDEEINAYYQKNQDQYRTEEQITIEYIDLSLDELAQKVEPTDEQLQAFYEEQKDLYTTPERRKISHILFAFSEDTDQDNVALEKALQAQQRLETEAFEKLAEELSDDTLTAKKGGDLGLFNVGEMEPAFEEAAMSLQKDEVSNPVKSAFGYHLIKVTELVEGSVKPYSEVKNDVMSSFQKSEAENNYYELAEILTEVSYENIDNLNAVSEAVGVDIKTTEPFYRLKGDGIAKEKAVRDSAFSADVLQGNNSEPIELGSDRVIVLRKLEYQPAETKKLKQVTEQVEAGLIKERAADQTLQQANTMLQQLQSGESLQDAVTKGAFELKTVKDLTRKNSELPWQLVQAVFKAAKPAAGKTTDLIVALSEGEQAVVSLLAVTEGKISEEDNKDLKSAESNIARVYGTAAFNSVLTGLESDADITIRTP